MQNRLRRVGRVALAITRLDHFLPAREAGDPAPHMKPHHSALTPPEPRKRPIVASQPDVATGHETSHRGGVHLRSLLEYVGMVASMFAGMVILGLIRDILAPGPVLRADLEGIIMASEMVIGMSAWMVARRHAWRGILVMSAVMYLPFLILAPLFWSGTISGDVLAVGGHLLMLPAMALAMPLTHRTRGRGARLKITEAPAMEAVASSGDLGATGGQLR